MEGKHQTRPIIYHSAKLEYNYFIKDLLGKVRTVLTEKQFAEICPQVSFEGAAGSGEVNNQNTIWKKTDGTGFDVVLKLKTHAVMHAYVNLNSPIQSLRPSQWNPKCYK